MVPAAPLEPGEAEAARTPGRENVQKPSQETQNRMPPSFVFREKLVCKFSGIIISKS
jgi:hypothetical protein